MENVKSNKNRKAAAIKYDPSQDAAPIISALGMGHMAERIIEIAQENEVPVKEDKAMSDVLMQLSVGDMIPPKLYEAVAEILIYISQQDGSFKSKLSF